MSRRKLRRGPSAWNGGWRWPVVAVCVCALVALCLPSAGRYGKGVYDRQRVEQYAGLIEREASANGLPAALVRSMVIAESGGDASAVSSIGALGLMQVRPTTAQEVRERFGLEAHDLLDPTDNVAIGTRYLAYLSDRFEGDTLLAVAAYHMGPTAISKLRSTYPQLSSTELVQAHAGPKTRAYVERVMRQAVDG